MNRRVLVAASVGVALGLVLGFQIGARTTGRLSASASPGPLPEAAPADADGPPGALPAGSPSLPRRRAAGASSEREGPAELLDDAEARAELLADLLAAEAQFRDGVPDAHTADGRRLLLQEMEAWLSAEGLSDSVRPVGLDCSEYPCLAAFLDEGAQFDGGGYGMHGDVFGALTERFGETEGEALLNHGVGLATKKFIVLKAFLPPGESSADPVRAQLLQIAIQERARRIGEALSASGAGSDDELLQLLRHIGVEGIGG